MRGTASPAEEGAATGPAIVTSIVGPCGRFIVPLEAATTAAFYAAAKQIGADPSEMLAEAVHSRIANVIAWAAETRQQRKTRRARQ